MQQSSHPVSAFRAWLALAIMIAAMLYALVDRQVFLLVAAEMSKTLRLSNTQLGLIQGVGFAALTLLGAYPIAWFADRYDRRWVLAICILCWAMGTAACGLANGFSPLFIAAGAVAVSEAGIAPIFMSMLPELFRGQARVTATMIYYVAVSLGMAAGMFVVGAMMAAVDALKPLPGFLSGLENWRLAYLAAAAPFPVLIAMIFFLPIGRVPGARAKATAAPITPFLRAHFKSVALVFGAMTFFALGVTSVLAWTPVSLTRIFGLSPASVGMVLGAVIAAASVAGVTAGNFVMPPLQRRIGYRAAPRIVWVSLIASLPLVCLIPFATAPWQVFACVGVQVFASTIAGASSVSLLQDLAPPEVRSRIMALRAMTNGPAIGLGIAGSAFLGDVIKAGPQSLFWGGLCITVPAWIATIVMLRLAEKPFEVTARESTGMRSPLDFSAPTKDVG
uniref:Major facilitator superfamily MFS_1 n=1 Tax=Caulobacter sp. (strain K31) TaxID=366602 RepID=B0SV27_CAUSK